jgi:ComF family protein
MNFVDKIKIFIKTIRNLLFPAKCNLCGEFVDSSGLCNFCWNEVNWIADPRCKICGTPFVIGINSICHSCATNKPYFDQAISVFEYNESSKGIIVKFKHFDATYLVEQLAIWMYRISEKEIKNADMIIPVPIHFWKRLKRKYNQSELLAREISKLSGVKYEPRILKKIKPTKQQEGLNSKKRRSNIVGSFGIDKKYENLLENKNILLIDDVFTTGSTVNECSFILKKSKAKSVIVVTAAMAVMHR